MRTYLFDDLGSLWHGLLGFIIIFLPLWLAVPTVLVFLIYEVREPEDPVATVGDVVEFLAGGFIGVLVLLKL